MMKATGIVRRMDELGRVVIPKELCRTHGIAPGDPMEFFAGDNGEITVRKFNVESPAVEAARLIEELTNDMPPETAKRIRGWAGSIIDTLTKVK